MCFPFRLPYGRNITQSCLYVCQLSELCRQEVTQNTHTQFTLAMLFIGFQNSLEEIVHLLICFFKPFGSNRIYSIY